MSKWQQELEMDPQPRSNTSLGNLHEGHDEERWAYMKHFYEKKCQAHQSTKFKSSWSWWRLWGLEKGTSLHELLYYFCASRPLQASVCMSMQYFESHHEFVLVVTIRELLKYLVDISCGDCMS